MNCDSPDAGRRGVRGSGPPPAPQSSNLPEPTAWGGYVGYVADLDGHLWELAHNPHFPFTADGRVDLPA